MDLSTQLSIPLLIPLAGGAWIWLARCALGLIALGWLLALVKVLVNRLRPRWVLTPGEPPAAPEIPVSVVIPARDEVRNIGPCLDAVLAQDHPTLQVVVMDDGSTDGTAEVLAKYDDDPRVTILSGDGAGLPEGWYGKPWALQRAQAAATGDWLLFTDADVRLAPEAVSRAVAWAEREQLGLLTGFGDGVMVSFWERALQPAVAGLILAGNDLDVVNDPDKPDRVIANGQFLLFTREAYDAVGGHEAVRSDILDDVGLAKAVVAAGHKLHCLYMRHIFACRMYTNLGEIWEGWTKNLFAGMGYSWPNVILALLYTFCVALLGPLLLVLGLTGALSSEWLWWGLGLTALMQTVRAVMDWIWDQPLAYGLLHAPSNVALMALILNSALKTSAGGVTWKGRRYSPRSR